METALLDKVRKLLAKAEDDACTPAEAEAFTAKAAELIAKYGIDAALLADARPGSDRVGDRTVAFDPPFALDKAGLLATVAVALRCGVVRRKDVGVDGRRRILVHLFGYGADLERVDLLCTSLLVQAVHALAGEVVPAGESAAAYRRSWYAGYTLAVGRRLRQVESSAAAASSSAAAQASGRSVALVLADRAAVVDAALREAYPRTRAGRGRSLSGSGGRSGYDAGQRADLGDARVGSSRRPALGT
jgi:hypothetical protein